MVTSVHPQARPVTTGPKRHFFGYYDKSPWDDSGKRLLAHEVDFDDRPPRGDDELVVGVIHLEDGNRFEPLGRTFSWNFQQGAMLHWLGPAHDRFVVYNVRRDDVFAAVVLDLQTKAERVLSRPVAAISRDGRWAMSLNFARLADMRPGYGYAGLADPWADVDSPEDDGIYRVDTQTGESRLILTTRDIAAFGDSPTAPDRKHWVNHTLFNPDGTRFSFLHRWETEDGGFASRLFTADLDGGRLCCLSDGGMVSHHDWLNPGQMLAWARKSQGGGGGQSNLVKLSSSPLFSVPPLSWAMRVARSAGAVGWLRQRVVGDRFILFTDQTGVAEDVGVGVLKEDGHCLYSPDRRWVLMDTYPHEDHHRGLFLYRPEDQRVIEIGRFYSQPDRTGEIRCDLHARFRRDGRQICIDSSHEGGRQMYVLDVAAVLAG